MRNIDVIKADISKLNAELADANEACSAQTSAVHILNNLGWKREKGTWVKPEVKAKPPISAPTVYSDRSLTGLDWVYIPVWKTYGRVKRTGFAASEVNLLSSRQTGAGIILSSHATSVPNEHIQRVRVASVAEAVTKLL